MKSNNLLSVSISLVIAGGFFASDAHAQNRDVSLMPIAADEPIAPAGFPPLPDRLDLPIAQAAQAANYRQPETRIYGGGYQHAPTIVPRKHSADEAFSEPERAPVNQQEGSQIRQRESGPPQRKFDRYGVIPTNQPEEQNVEAPKPVTVDQARPQDLSLPNDTKDYSGGHAPRRDGVRNQLHDQFIKKPLQDIRSRFGIL
ncbi:MAG: hypothetical protein JST89_23950 [Cyanobacteria bacterium SZAS-4]|nr:hypothetical protein [Cyanobacteria bacterium SZAS-4]